MSTKKTKVPESRPAEPGLPRRSFLHGGLGLALAWSFPEAIQAGPTPAVEKLLANSEFVYVSPLRSSGQESQCHGEVWYGWFDGDVVLITARSTWKGRAFLRGLDRAKIWVGDHGIWKRWWGTNEDFRKAPSFTAKATSVRDDALMERLMKLYATKYPAEFDDWEANMRAGYASGERLLLRYRGEF